MQIKLGEDQIESLTLIKDIGAEGIALITKFLNDLDKPPLTPEDLDLTILKALGDSIRDQSRPVTVQILSLYNLMQIRDLSAGKTIEIVTEALRQSELKWTDEDFKKWTNVSLKLQELISFTGMPIIVKASGLVQDYEKSLRGARILTDLRPVFNYDADDIEAFLITQKLRVDFETEDGFESIEINMDNEDIEMLLSACKRALKKAKLLKANVESKMTISSRIVGE